VANQNWAHTERLALCDLLTEIGPDAPTLCAGWTTADLAAHLVVRERRPDAAVGVLVPPLAGYGDRIRRRMATTTPFPQVVEQIRQGPPAWSFFGLPGMENLANTAEFFIHHEDIRRGRPGWAPRALPPPLEELMWRRLKMARFALRRVPVELTVVDPNGRTQQVSKGGRQARVHGLPSELTLWISGRKDAARVELTGEAEAVNALSTAQWGL
jgi:uncharacterized protein (TIGR03085 family)